jgi:hypothetical protein
MSEFFAWAATGIVVGLQSWSEGDHTKNNRSYNSRGTLIDRQRFFLRQRDGREIEIFLVDSGIAFRNGHAITAVWAARQDASYGHCIYLENHSTGASACLPENGAQIRSRIKLWKASGIGFLGTFATASVLLALLISQHGTDFLQQKAFLISAGIALALLVVFGVVVVKLVADYIRTDDNQKIWAAAEKALANARRVLLQKPQRRQPRDHHRLRPSYLRNEERYYTYGT